jgi:hypothetical protein
MKYLLFVLSTAALWMTSCITDGVTTVESEDTMEFSVALPSPQRVATRAATPEDENKVAVLWLLPFDPSTGRLTDVLSCAITSGNGTSTITFKARVPYSSNPRDLMLVANVSVTNISAGMTRAEVQEGLRQESSQIWSIGGTDLGNHIPMCGELKGRVISSDFDPSVSANKFSLRRMLARVNVTMESAAKSKFEVIGVSFANYNCVGNLVPNFEAGNNTPSVPTGSNNKQRGGFLNYSAADLTNTIYVFENEHVAPWPKSGWVDNPCIVVEGIYDANGDGKTDALDGDATYYRLDFVRGNDTWFSVVRNHSYNFTISAVGGKGYPTKEDALRSAPINITVNVVDWDDSDEITGGKWAGEQYIHYTGINAYFDQFGQPGPQTFRVTTNVPDLTFGNFTDIDKSVMDAGWGKDSAGNWSNDHFMVDVISEQRGAEYIHTLTISAACAQAADNMDVGRKTVFQAATSLMSLDFEITQDQYVEYKLITTPDPTGAIVVDGAAQRIRIGVESTHEDEIGLDGQLFDGVYTDATGDTRVNGALPTTTKAIWVGIGENVGVRYGQLMIRHSVRNSPASAAVYNVLQVTPWISALFEGGKYSIEADANGGEYTVNVSSNMALWEPAITIADPESGAVLRTIPTEELGDWFDVVGGSQNGTVKIIIPAIPEEATTDLEYRIRFKNASDGAQTASGTFADLTVLQKLGEFTFNPSTFESVPAAGDVTEWIEVETGAGFWSFDKVAYGSTKVDGRRLVKHNAVIEVQNFNANGTPAGDPGEYELRKIYPKTTRFRVRFPKIYYPNRGIEPSVSLTVKVGGMRQTITARQTPLTAKPLSIYQVVTGTIYGAFYEGENYIAEALKQSLLSEQFTIENYGAGSYGNTVPVTTTLLYSVYNNNQPWTTTNDYRSRSIENWSMIQSQNEAPAVTAAGRDDSPLKAAGYTLTDVVTWTAHPATLNSDQTVRATKLMRYLLEKSPKNCLNEVDTSVDGRAAGVFWQDDISTVADISNSNGTPVPLIVTNIGVSTFIDIKNRIFWMGETEHFGSLITGSPTRRVSGDQLLFTQNIADFMAKAVAYGSAFTDLLLEEDTKFDAGDNRAPQPAPWDEYWDDTDNGGTDNRLKPVQ